MFFLATRAVAFVAPSRSILRRRTRARRSRRTIAPSKCALRRRDRRIRDPLTVDFRRAAPAPHATFGNGPHICPGAILARREIKIFLQEWLKRIPVFGIEPGTKPVLVTGMVNGVLELRLTWSLA